jgi:hypothetical protein
MVSLPAEPEHSHRSTDKHYMPHGTDSLLLQLFTIFVWAKVFGELFERMHMPAVLGEILAGDRFRRSVPYHSPMSL